MRYFNHFYGQFKISKKLNFITGFDIGFQQKIKKSAQYNLWFTPIAIAKYNWNNKLASAFRIEYYEDNNSVIIPTINNNSFKTFGFSINMDYAFNEMLVWRVEARNFYSKNKIFEKNASYINSNFFLVTSLSIKFDEILH